MNTTTYYQCRESNNVYAIVEGSSGIFRLFSSDLVTGPWTFHAPSTTGWDFAHQKIFRQYIAIEINPEKHNLNLPELPDLPSGPFPSWAENFGKGSRLPCSDFPLITKLLESTLHNGQIFVILREDCYESMSGDGLFRDFYTAFFSRQDADKFIQLKEKEMWYRFSLKEFSVAIDDNELISPDFEPTNFEHYKMTTVLEAIEEGLLKSYLDNWEKGSLKHLSEPSEL